MCREHSNVQFTNFTLSHQVQVYVSHKVIFFIVCITVPGWICSDRHTTLQSLWKYINLSGVIKCETAANKNKEGSTHCIQTMNSTRHPWLHAQTWTRIFPGVSLGLFVNNLIKYSWKYFSANIKACSVEIQGIFIIVSLKQSAALPWLQRDFKCHSLSYSKRIIERYHTSLGEGETVNEGEGMAYMCLKEHLDINKTLWI